jgi:hypothetical protein
MSEAYLYDPTTFAILFEFDCDTKESRDGSTQWTDKPVEAGANVTDFGNRAPEKFQIEGIITAWPFGSPHNPLRVSGADDALRAIADAGQPVGLVTKWWSAEVVLSADKASNSQGEGEALRFSVSAQTIRVPSPDYVTIPASRLKASVRKRATAPPAGGSAAGKTKPTETDWIYKGAGFLGFRFT